jgi:hypothetical protein
MVNEAWRTDVWYVGRWWVNRSLGTCCMGKAWHGVEKVTLARGNVEMGMRWERRLLEDDSMDCVVLASKGFRYIHHFVGERCLVKVCT